MKFNERNFFLLMKSFVLIFIICSHEGICLQTKTSSQYIRNENRVSVPFIIFRE